MPNQGELPPRDPSVTLREVAAGLVHAHAPVVVGLLDLEGRLVALDGALAEKLGYDAEELVGRPYADIVVDPVTHELLERGLAGESLARTTTLNGRTWLVAVEPVVDDQGDQVGLASVLTFADEAEVHQELSATEALKEQFGALIEMSKDFIAIADLDGTVTFVNQAGRELVGLVTDEETLGRPTDDYFTDEGRAKSHEIEEAVRGQGYWEGETFLRHFPSGASIPVSANSFLVTRSSDGTPLALATVQRDMRTRIRQEDALRARVQEQRAIAELGRLALTSPVPELLKAAVDLIHARYPSLVAGVLRRRDDRMELVASSVADWVPVVLSLDDDSLTGRSMLRNEVVTSDDVVSDPAFPHEAATTRFGMRSALSVPIPGGDSPWGSVGASSTESRAWTEDDVVFVEAVAATLGAAVRRQELEDQLQHQALHDALTGLPNRALVMDRISHALDRGARSGGLLAVVLIDLDDFKTVNDSLGHGRGDDLLSALAVRFGEAVRTGDTVGRLGGDEFVVVCEDVRTEEEVAFVVEALLEACSSPVAVADHRVSVSASAGVSLAVAGDATTPGLLSEADIAMYRAKRDRPGTYRIFDEEMRGDLLGRMNVAGELRAAVRADALDVDYQPIVDLTDGRVVAMEALARWTNEAGERVPPDVFIPVAEETGLIGELGACVLRIAARQAAAWQEATPHPVGVRVNASAHELRSRGYVDRVLGTLAETGLPAGLLGLEITESALVDEDKSTQETLTRLRDAGVSLMIDDFGTGYSSLSYLQRFPVVDVLKVDRSFLVEGPRGEAVVRAVVGLGRAFGLQVCAEGVETPEQLSRVAELGCDFAQGYLLSRPVPAGHSTALLAGWDAQRALAIDI